MATFNNSGDGPFGPVVNGTQIVFFEYRPSKPAGYAFMSLFATVTLIHLGYMLRYRGWFFIPFILGGCCKCFPLSSHSPAHVYNLFLSFLYTPASPRYPSIPTINRM